MSVPQPRFLATYNSLTDKHLVGYFNNARIRRHLQKSGLISRSGRIIPEKEYRLNAMRRDHQRHVRECLARAILRKVLDMERHHQLEIKRKLESSARKERMQKIKMEQFRGSLEDVIPVHSPHPPLSPRNHNGLIRLVAGERAGRSQRRAPGLGVDCSVGHSPHQHRTKEPAPKVSSLRPNTAPGNIQQPLHLQPLHDWAAAGSVPKAFREKCHDQQFARGGERSELRLMNSVECVAGISPYQLPVINPCVVPVPPPRLHGGDRRVSGVRGGQPRRRRFGPITAFNEQVLIKHTGGFPKSPLCSNALVTMVYIGKSGHVPLNDYWDDIQIYQQHCGGENLCVYKGKLFEGDTFQFTSKRHHGFPFSLTFFINGMQADRLSCCCEYKQHRHSRLRGKHRYFRVLNVEGAYPCYRCILAMGLDKKPSPPKRKREYQEEKLPESSWEFAVHSEPSSNSIPFEQKSGQDSLSVLLPAHEVSEETVDETLETEEDYRKEEMETQSGQESEDSGEDTNKNEYDEDFEADEEANEEGQTGDQMNGMSESFSDDKNPNLDYGKERETSSQKALQASGSKRDQSDGYSDRDSEDDQQKRRPVDSLSSISTQCSTEVDSHTETMTDNVNGKVERDIKSASGSAAHSHYGNENGEKNCLRPEENQETSALEKKGIDEAEKTKPEGVTLREDTRIFHENIMAMQYPNPEVNGEFRQAGSGESNMNEEEECLPEPCESRMLNMEGGNEECPQSKEGGGFKDCKPVQEEIAKATGNGHPVNSDPEPGDLYAGEEEEKAASTECDVSGAPGGSFLAEGRRSLDVQEAAGQAVREGRVTGQRQALQQDSAAEGGDAGSREARGKAALVGNSLLQENKGSALEESAPEEGAVAEERAKEKGTGDTVKLGTEVSPGEQDMLLEGMEGEVALGKPAPGGEGPAGALPGWEADRAVSQGQERAGCITEEEDAEEGLKAVAGPPAEEGGKPVSEAGESLGEGESAGNGALVRAVSDGEEAEEDADVAAGGIAGVVGPEGEEAVEEDISEGVGAVKKPGALWEVLGDMETGEAMPGGEGFVKPNEFSQLKVSGKEQMETGKAVPGGAALESGQAWEVGGNALRGVENTREAPVEPGKGPVLEMAPGLGALGGARVDPVTEVSSQVEEGAAEALWSGNPSAGSKAETERAVTGKPDGEAVGGSAGVAGAGSEGEEEATDGAAGSKEPAAGAEGWLRCGEVRGKARAPGERLVGEAALPAPGKCGSRAGEPGLVAIAVVGGQAERGALAGEPALARGLAVAEGDGVGTGAVAQEGVTGAVLGAQSSAGTTVAEKVPGTGRGAVGESGGHGEGVLDRPVADGREVDQEAAVGHEGRAPVPAGVEDQGEAEREWGAVRLVSPGHGEVFGTMSLGEQPTAETFPSTPAHGDGRVEQGGTGSTAREGLRLGTEPQLAAAETARGTAGRQEEEMLQARAKAEREQPSPRDNTRESKVEEVSVSAGSAAGAGEQRKDNPIGGSSDVLGAADVGERSRSPHQDGANPDLAVMSLEQRQDGEETLL